MKGTFTGKDLAYIIAAIEPTRLTEITCAMIRGLNETAFLCWLGTTINTYADYYNMSTEDTLQMMDTMKELIGRVHKELGPMEVSK